MAFMELLRSPPAQPQAHCVTRPHSQGLGLLIYKMGIIRRGPEAAKCVESSSDVHRAPDRWRLAGAGGKGNAKPRVQGHGGCNRFPAHRRALQGCSEQQLLACMRETQARRWGSLPGFSSVSCLEL